EVHLITAFLPGRGRGEVAEVVVSIAHTESVERHVPRLHRKPHLAERLPRDADQGSVAQAEGLHLRREPRVPPPRAPPPFLRPPAGRAAAFLRPRGRRGPARPAPRVRSPRHAGRAPGGRPPPATRAEGSSATAASGE